MLIGMGAIGIVYKLRKPVEALKKDVEELKEKGLNYNPLKLLGD
jgi:hypothetical protein